MTMTVQVKRKKKVISQQLQDALDSISLPDIPKLQPYVDRVFTIGREEGLSDKEIGKLIRQKMKGHYGHDTIWRIFEKYPEARQKQNHKKVPKIGTFDEDDDKKETDKFQHYRQVIESKNKLLKQKDEEIKGLKQQLAQANKRIKELESKSKLKPKENKPKPPKKVQGTAADKAKLLDDAMQFRQGLIEQERRRSSDE